MFSVLMSVYAKEKAEYLSEAIESIVNQTLQTDDFVIVADGKLTEELYACLKKYQERYDYIHIYPMDENVKLGRALCFGIQHCRHDLVARMDSDDWSVAERFAVEYQFMQEHPEIAVVSGSICEFDEFGKKVYKKLPLTSEEIYAYGKYRNPVNHVTAMYRKAAVVAAGNYEHFPYMEDYYLWCRMFHLGYQFQNIPEVLVEVRTYSSMYQRRGGLEYIKWAVKLRREQRAMGELCFSEYVKAVIMSVGMALIPGWVRKVIYQKILRSGK